MATISLIILAVTAAAAAFGWRRTASARKELERAVDRAVDRLGSTAQPDRRAEAIEAAARRASEDIATERTRSAQYEATLEQAPLGVIIVDGESRIAFVNEGGSRYLRARHGDAIAEGLIRECVEEAADRGSWTTREVELYTPTRRMLGLQAMPLSVEGSHVGVVVFLEDLTERHRVDAIRKDFVANASHELKTPLGAVSVLAETLADSDDPDVRHRLTERLGVETHRMSRLIDDILDLSLVEGTAGDRAPVSVAEVMGDAAKHVGVISEQYGVPVDVSSVDAEVRVAGDHRQLVSAVSNLLENAIKYTHTPSSDEVAPVELNAETMDGRVVIRVKDHGIGISRQHLPRIFERFYRVDRARSRSTGGTGLGLAIVRHVVRNHDGTIDVDSEPSVGSVFSVSLPLWRE